MMPPPGIVTCITGGPEDAGGVAPRPTPGDGRPLPAGISLRIFRCSHPLRLPDCTRHNPSRLVCTTTNRMNRMNRKLSGEPQLQATATYMNSCTYLLVDQLSEGAASGGRGVKHGKAHIAYNTLQMGTSFSGSVRHLAVFSTPLPLPSLSLSQPLLSPRPITAAPSTVIPFLTSSSPARTGV